MFLELTTTPLGPIIPGSLNPGSPFKPLPPFRPLLPGNPGRP